MAIAQASMRKHCPSCVVEGFEACHGGNISTVYEIRCAHPAQPIILKVYPDTFHWKMAKEVYVYSLFDPAEGVPTPFILRRTIPKRSCPTLTC